MEDGRLVKAEPRKVYLPRPGAADSAAGPGGADQRAVTIERQGSASDPVPILDGMDRIRAFKCRRRASASRRYASTRFPFVEYIYGDLLSHVLGFMGPIPAFAAEDYKETGYTDPNEKVGLNGLEYSYQDELRGAPGLRFVERDILGTDVRAVGPVRDAVPGWNLNLSIDLRLQRAMHDALKEAKDSATIDKGVPWAVAIAMNPQNGQILGMVSLPSYDNNIFAEEHRRRLSGAGKGRTAPADQLCHRRPLPARLNL